LYFPQFAKNLVFLNKNTGGEKNPEIRILFFNFSETFFLLFLHSYTCQHKFIFTRNTKCWKQETQLFLLSLEMNHTFPVLHLKTTKEFCFLLLQKGEKFVLMLSRALFFGIFCFCVWEFYFLIRADNATFIWYTIIGQHQHQQPTYQQPTHLQQTFVLRKPWKNVTNFIKNFTFLHGTDSYSC
jgi:hypothetical protein